MSTAQQQHAAAQPAYREDSGKQALDEALNTYEKRRRSVVGDAASFLGVPAAKVFDVLRNVWKTSKGQPDLTDKEIFNGLVLISRYELDPFAKEVYVTRDGKGRLLTIIGIDGWVKILDRTDHYDGFDVEIRQDDKGNVEWIETSIYSTKRKHPAVYRAFAAEYRKIAGIVAQTIPTHMLRIFSLRHAARLFVPLGGLVVTEEEARAMDRLEPQETLSGNERLAKALAQKSPKIREDAGEPSTAEDASPPTETQQDANQGTEAHPETSGEPNEAQDAAAMASIEFEDMIRAAADVAALEDIRREVMGDSRMDFPGARKPVLELIDKAEAAMKPKGKRGRQRNLPGAE